MPGMLTMAGLDDEEVDYIRQKRTRQHERALEQQDAARQAQAARDAWVRLYAILNGERPSRALDWQPEGRAGMLPIPGVSGRFVPNPDARRRPPAPPMGGVRG